MSKKKLKQNKIIRNPVILALIIGFLSSLVIGMYFKLIESYYGIKVYSLLLNIDYFPLLKNYDFPEIIEFSFHSFVSIIIVYLFIFFGQKYKWSKRDMTNNVLFISVAIGVFIYPTTILSYRTPEIFSAIAFFHWSLGHLLFGLTVNLAFKLILQ